MQEQWYVYINMQGLSMLNVVDVISRESLNTPNISH